LFADYEALKVLGSLMMYKPELEGDE